tara:strand:- start:560 stop:1123 length:564 start_codon:yes stop_codon:yes gene_type:complete
MTVTPTKINDLVILEPRVFGDGRGYFLESFKTQWWKEHYPGVEFVQDNESKSKRGVLRGLHFQTPPFAQAKLVRVIQGEVLDVAVDLRADSPTYGKYDSVLLSEDNKRQLFVPRGFAHGFVVLSETAIFSYKVDNVYAPNNEGGILWNDTDLNIDWQIDANEVLLSGKDKLLQHFSAFQSPFRMSEK